MVIASQLSHKCESFHAPHHVRPDQRPHEGLLEPRHCEGSLIPTQRFLDPYKLSTSGAICFSHCSQVGEVSTAPQCDLCTLVPSASWLMTVPVVCMRVPTCASSPCMGFALCSQSPQLSCFWPADRLTLSNIIICLPGIALQGFITCRVGYLVHEPLKLCLCASCPCIYVTFVANGPRLSKLPLT